ncbi:MAG: NADH:flavin oxidoreductase [Pseudomonadota bacterium]
MSLEALFKPFNKNKLQLQNRIVMAPMTRSRSLQHIPNQANSDYYYRRAAGGVGLIITEGTAIDHPASHAYPDVPNIFGEQALAGWHQVIQRVHSTGAKIFPQLWHVGSVRQNHDQQNSGVDNPRHCCHCDENKQVPGYAPSAVAHPYVKNARIPAVLTQKEIDAIIAAYAKAAREAKAIGFDGIELHGAHGYLIDQFFWELTNRRDDHYGGKTLAERTRFAVEVIAAVRQAVGSEYPISLRFSQWKLGAYQHKMAKTPKELEQFLLPLVNAGVDIFHCSTRRFFQPEFSDGNLNLAGWVKKMTGKTTITVGSVGLDNDFTRSFAGEATNLAKENLTILTDKLTAGEFDLVAVGRMLLANPDWPEKLKAKNYDSIKTYSKACLENYY